jgi:hypothetical protein
VRSIRPRQKRIVAIGIETTDFPNLCRDCRAVYAIFFSFVQFPNETSRASRAILKRIVK